MRTSPYIAGVIGAILISAGSFTAHAEGRYYDPSNTASPSGSTIGHELYKTIGCPAKPCWMRGVRFRH